MVAMFFLSNLLTVPVAIQDMIMQIVTTTASGYTILLHVQLYKIYPVLVAIPAIFIAALIHFFVQSNKAQSKVALAKMLRGAESRVNEDLDKKRQRKEYRQKLRRCSASLKESTDNSQDVEDKDTDSFIISIDFEEDSSVEFSSVSSSKAIPHFNTDRGSETLSIYHHVNRRMSIQQGISALQHAANQLEHQPIFPWSSGNLDNSLFDENEEEDLESSDPDDMSMSSDEVGGKHEDCEKDSEKSVGHSCHSPTVNVHAALNDGHFNQDI
jgi:hypothetical protein